MLILEHQLGPTIHDFQMDFDVEQPGSLPVSLHQWQDSDAFYYHEGVTDELANDLPVEEVLYG
jgi:hypothetical protein